MQDLAGTLNLSAGDTFWTPKSAAPVEFSATPVGTLGAVDVAGQWRRATDTAGAPMDTVISGVPAPGVPDVDPLTDRPRLRQPVRAPAPRHQPHVAGLRHRRVTVLDSSIAYSDKGNLPPADGGDRGRYTVLPAAAPRFAAVTPLATPQAVLLHRRPRPLRRA